MGVGCIGDSIHNYALYIYEQYIQLNSTLNNTALLSQK